MTKICTKCHKEKPLTEFYKSNRVKDGRRADCGECNKNSVSERHKKDPEAERARQKRWRENNPDKVKEQYKKSRPKMREWVRERYANDEEYRQKTILSVRAYRENPKNKEAVRKSRKNSMEKKKRDPKFRITMNLRRRMNTVLLNYTKDSSTIKLVGCTWEELRAHIESQFTEGMTWENYGKLGWHLDHIRGCANFDMSDPEQQKACFHYTNLQPLWWYDNLLKKDLSMEEFEKKKKDWVFASTEIETKYSVSDSPPTSNNT